MTERLVDIDDADPEAAEALVTSTTTDMMTRAQRQATAAAARRREIERLVSGASSALADQDERNRAWRK